MTALTVIWVKLMDEVNRASLFLRLKSWYRSLPDKKKYLEVVTAFLSIPVLLTVLINNTLNLQNQRKSTEPSPSPSPVSATPTLAATPSPLVTPTVIFIPLATQSGTQTATPTPAPECIKGVGPVNIAYPQESEVVSGDPICLDISRQSSNYCSIVWSYRINNSAWSDYLDKSICMYGLTPGQKKLELRVRSVVTNEEVNLNRTFIVDGPTPMPTATDSAQVTTP